MKEYYKVQNQKKSNKTVLKIFFAIVILAFISLVSYSLFSNNEDFERSRSLVNENTELKMKIALLEQQISDLENEKNKPSDNIILNVDPQKYIEDQEQTVD